MSDQGGDRQHITFQVLEDSLRFAASPLCLLKEHIRIPYDYSQGVSDVMGQHSQKLSPLLFQFFSGGNIAMDRENADRGAHFVTEKAGAGLNRHHTAIATHK